MLLSAGFGTRLAPLSDLRPKPLFPVLNRSMLGIWLERLDAAGVGKVVVNVHWLAPMVVEHIEGLRRRFPGMEIAVSQEEGILGTGGGLKNAEGHFDGPFFAINSDIYTDLPLAGLEEAFFSEKGLSAVIAAGAFPGGTISADKDGNVLAFRSPRAVPGESARLYGLGLMALDPDVLGRMEPGPSDAILCLGAQIREGARVRARLFDRCLWRDIGTAADYYSLNSHLAAGGRFVEEGASIECETGGFLAAESGAVARKGAFLEDCILWGSAVVEEGASLRSMVVAGSVRAGVKMTGGVVTGR
jgi:mannose-1-phosphate guanylyltransferase